jgi:hypothetical protein
MAGPQASTEARPTILPEQVLQLSYSTPSTFKNHSEWPVPMMRRPPLFIVLSFIHLVGGASADVLLFPIVIP